MKFFCLALETLKQELKGRHWSPPILDLLLKAFEYDNISFCTLMSMIILHFPWGKWSAAPSYCRKSIDKKVRILGMIVNISCYHYYKSNRLSPQWRSTSGGRVLPITYYLTMCSREIFTKKSRQQQNFDSDLKEAWHYNHVTFTPIANFFAIL